jgi:peptide/nickel transport system substrate-binding protein
VARALALAATLAVPLLAVSGAGGAPVQTPKRGGTLVYAQPTPEPACLTPAVLRCTPGVSWISQLRVYNLVLERPFDVGRQLERRPKLVVRVDRTRKPPFTLTYHIRREARWSDGEPVTARDFIFTLRVNRKYDPGFRERHSSIRSIRAVDAKTVRLVLRPRQADWPSYFGNVLPSHALRGEDITKVWVDRIENPRTGEPIASGPFLVERWQRGEQLVLRRNPNYWGPHDAYLDRLILRLGVDPGTMLDGSRSGRPQIAWGFPPEFASEFRREPDLRVLSSPTTTKDFLWIRTGPGGHRALRVKGVRRALAYAVDRVAIVRSIFGEVEQGVEPSDSAVYLTQDRHYRPNWKDYRLRRAVSRRLLQQAGCTRGVDGIYACAGKELSLRLVTMAGRTDRALAAELVQKQLREVGIEAIPTFLPANALFDPDSPVNRGEFDLAVLGFIFEPGSEAGGSHDLFGCGRGVASAGYCQRLVTRDLDQASRILDPEQRAIVLNRADVQLAKDVPALPLYQLRLVAAVHSTIRGFALSPTPTQLMDAENWWLASGP